MKRFLILATALLMACSAEEDEMNLVKPKSPVRFYAEVEGLGSRTQLDAKGLTCWNADDRITIYTGETYNREFAFDGEDGAPSGGYDQVSIDKTFYSAYDVDANYAIYPHQASNQLKPYSTSDPSQGGYFVATLPAEQAYAKNSFGRGAFTMVAVTQNVSDGRLIFKNVGGCIVLSLYGADQPIVRVTVEGNNSEKLAGKANIAHKNGGLPTTTMQSTATTSVSVVNDEGILLGTTPETATEFWLAVPPTTFEQGFTITVEGADGTTYTKSTSKKQSVERNVFLMMPAIEVDFWGEGSSVLITENQKLLYTTTDGNPLSFSEGYTMGEATLVSHTYTNGQGVMVFNKEITSINGYMFYGNETLQTITLPSTLKEIEMLAFWRCTNLQNVTLPEGLTTLGMGAFTGCESFTSVTLPESLTNTDENLFRNCTSLAEFKGKYASEDGRCLIIEGELNSFAPAGLTSYAIPDGVTRVGEDSFNGCANLSAVTIPDGVKELGNWVFWQCTALTSIEIPASVTQIGVQCFGECTLLSEIYCNPTTPPALESDFWSSDSWLAFDSIAEDAKIYVPAESIEAYKTAEGWSDYADMICAQSQPANEIWYTSTDGNIVEPFNPNGFGANIVSNSYESGQGVMTFDGPVTEIGDEAFYKCNTLSNITIPESVSSIGFQAFTLCENLTSIDIPDNVAEIEWAAFSACKNLKKVKLPSELTAITADLFETCYSLTDIAIPDGVTSIGYGAFSFCTSLTSVKIPDSVTEIGDFAFYYCHSLASVTIPDGVTSIGEGAFVYCSLTNVTIPDGVTSIGEEAFLGCRLESVTIPDSVTEIEDGTFAGCDQLTTVTIPNSIVSIGEGVFRECGLTCVTIPDSVTSIGSGAFQFCFLMTAFYGKFASEDNLCLIVDGVLNAFAVGSGATEYTIPDSVTSIGDYAFGFCDKLTTVTIPDGVTSIGDWAFCDCHNLASVYCKPTTPPSAIYSELWEAFDNIAEGAKIYVPAESVEAYKAADGWSDYADMICAQSQPANEIWYTSTDGNIVEPYDTTVFGATLQSNTYSNGKGVMAFDGPVTEVGSYAFKDLVNLVTIILPEQVTKIGDSAFYKCENLFDITIPNEVNTIDFGAFCACSNLTNINIPNSLSSLGALAFWNCKCLTDVIIPEGITSIKYDTFLGCNNLTNVNIPNSVESIESSAFLGCNLTNVNIPNDVRSIGEKAFYGCDNLENMVLGSGIVSISGNAFYGCTGNLVVNCNIPNAASGPESAFYNSKFTSITIEDGVTSIGNYAFYGCENTKDVIISNSVTKIGDAAFCGCDFESIRIPDSVTSIGMGAFSTCDKLENVRIPDNVEVIKEYTFLDCSSLTSVTIGAGTTTIEDKAFYRCTGLKNIFFRSNIPPTRGAETFYAAFDFALYVPESDDDSIINAYKVADGWSGYADKMVEYEF